MKNTQIKKLLSSLLISFIFITAVFSREYKITKHEGSMSWTIDSTDSEGSPSRIYIVGTIHLADESIYPVPDYILDAWDDADTVYGEISSKDWGTYYSKFTAHLCESVIKDDFDIETVLSEEEIKTLKNSVGAANYNNFKKFEPWVYTATLSGTVFKDCTLKPGYSYDVFFIKKANEEDVEMFGLDTLQEQLDVISYGSREVQIKLLKDSLASIINSEDSSEDIEKLFAAYKTGDADYFTDVYHSQLAKEIERESVYKEYYENMLTKRNKKWAKKIRKILDEGGVTFIFAGVGHFTGNESVFDFLEKEMSELSEPEHKQKSTPQNPEAYNTVKERKKINDYDFR